VLTIYLRALGDAAAFVGVPILAMFLICALVVTGFSLFGSAAYRRAFPYGLAFRLAVAFSAYAFALGIFVGMTGDMLVTTVVGTVITLATTYLTYLFGKDAVADAPTVLAPALIAFFINTPLAIDYVLQYHAILAALAANAAGG
jgi:hypothetical protein